MSALGQTETFGPLWRTSALPLVQRRVNGADRRARELRTTPSAKTLRRRVRPRVLAAQASVLAPLGLPVRHAAACNTQRVNRAVGATYKRGWWTARIRCDNRRIFLGCCRSRAEANLAYRKARLFARIAADEEAARLCAQSADGATATSLKRVRHRDRDGRRGGDANELSDQGTSAKSFLLLDQVPVERSIPRPRPKSCAVRAF